ncbi:MotA/TolQ/ExbB proton channel family protein [Acuticoccus yangtzensis]|uniref:MotA/TolQ/ExbB proton channel family protein n=1 Tax=Acuticoccus yangtzensis TaxID=1443441 RepID=UPI000AFF5F2A|nr:MotA/TolQ/ExbB proton channel family protein [Acuticoccus yangtzensis]
MNFETIVQSLVARLQAEDGILSVLALGGPVVMLLVALSVVMIAVSLIKLAQFARAGVGRHGAAERAVETALRGEADGRQRSGGPLSRQVIALQIAEGTNTADAREAAESYAALRLHQLRKLVNLLDTIAQISPLLGLFGTVLGMIEAFQALEGAGSAVDPSILAGGIWVALLTTAVGLAVAMPASVISSWFESRIENERVALDTLISRLATGSRAGRLAHPARRGAGPRGPGDAAALAAE